MSRGEWLVTILLLTLWLLVFSVILASGASIDPRIPRRPLGYLYHAVPVDQFGSTVHTHVCTTGRVTVGMKNADGDRHFTVREGAAKIIAEIIPQIPLLPPRAGTLVTVCGIRRYDDKHKWWEIHPVESWWAQ